MNFEHISIPLKKNIRDIENVSKHRGILGLSTGFHDFDLLTNGLLSGNLIIIGAPSSPSSMGKMRTRILRNIALHVDREQKGNVKIFNRIDLLQMQEDMETIVRRVKRKQPNLALAIFDDCITSYSIQEQEIDKDMRELENEIYATYNMLKIFAGLLMIPVIASVEVIYKNTHYPLPQCYDIENPDAPDIIAFLYRDDYSIDEGVETSLFIKKHRNGPCGVLNIPKELDRPAIPDIIPDQFNYRAEWWEEYSYWYKEQRGWQCDQCKLSLNKHRHFLHVHHIHGTKHNEPKDLTALCIGCHSEQLGFHEQLKETPDYENFVKIYGDKWQTLYAKANDI